jgi:DtxR family Mn-dependent transcriptional regulator
MAANDKLSNSLEDYLETIYPVVREQGSARSRDIASRLQVTPASVTEALRDLGAREHVISEEIFESMSTRTSTVRQAGPFAPAIKPSRIRR